jgi:hypothetical protein
MLRRRGKGLTLEERVGKEKINEESFKESLTQLI